ncbi:MAG TPA: hypothetical protein VF230_11935 [Acidimicrobiales bacterium]
MTEMSAWDYVVAAVVGIVAAGVLATLLEPLLGAWASAVAMPAAVVLAGFVGVPRRRRR